MIGKYYENMGMSVKFEISKFTKGKITRKQKIKFWETKIKENVDLVKNLENSISILEALNSEYENHKDELKEQLEAIAEKRHFNKELREAKLKEQERRKTPLIIEWHTPEESGWKDSDLIRKEIIENYDNVGYLKLMKLSQYRNKVNKFEVFYGFIPSFNNFINKVNIGQELHYFSSYKKSKRFPTIEEAEKFYSEKKAELTQKVRK